jgi:DHA2 family multidrug resistance protein
MEDWLGSTFICWTLAIAVVGWIGTILWELYAKEPIIEFRLLKNRNFAIASTLFFVFGFGLFGTTTLVPQLLQSLYGFRAIDAGLVLGPGAFVITVLAPISAQLIQRHFVHPKVMMLFSLSAVAASMWYFSSLNLATDGGHYLLGRVFQGIGYGFFFVPVNMIAYSMLRPDQNNKASSLTNLFRNWGGSFGIAMVTTLGERRQNVHQINVGSSLGSTSLSLQHHIQGMTDYLISKGFTTPDAVSAAYGTVYSQLHEQTQFLAFMDCFRVIGWLTLAAVPVAFLVKRFVPAGKPSVGH